MYPGVTLGGTSWKKGKRHPTIGDRVVVYAGATVLGGTTEVGHDSIVGGNVFLTSSLPPGSIVYSTNQLRIRSASDGFEAADFVI